MATSSPPWSELLPKLLGRVIARLTLTADRARFRAVCRAWHSAARRHARQLGPWLVLPDGSFCTIGGGGSDGATCYFHRDTIPGLPENVTCVGSTDSWLALDRNDDEAHRSYLLGKACTSCSRSILDDDVKRRPSYLLHNPFSGATLPLPELDGIITSVSRRFRIRKVLMRSSDPDDVIAVVTNNWNYNIILLRPGKQGTDVLRYFRVVDVAFLGDWLYGITPDEDLFAFRIEKEGIDEDSDDDDGDDSDGSDDNDNNDEAGNNEEGEDDEAPNKGEEHSSSSGEKEEDEDPSSGDMISDDEVIVRDDESTNDPEYYISTTRI